jgi:RNA polymerase-binding transcription factor DksA
MSHDKHKAMLLKRLEELKTRLEGIEDSLDEPKPSDWDESATEREGDEVLETLGTSGQAEIGRIEAALRRMDEGEYGYCLTCGEAISEARLDILPEAPLCAACAGGRKP